MKILCFGDSNTYGYDPRSFFGGRYRAENRWVDLMGDALGCAVINAGENGRCIPTREGELRCMEQILSDHNPLDLLLIMLGTNDLLQGVEVDKTVKNMESFLMDISFEHEKVLLIGPPPMGLGNWVPDRSLVKASAALCRGCKDLAERLGLRFADAGEWDIPLAFDGVHFTEEGHGKFAVKIVKQIKGE